jgi:hypothetical protein
METKAAIPYFQLSLQQAAVVAQVLSIMDLLEVLAAVVAQTLDKLVAQVMKAVLVHPREITVELEIMLAAVVVEVQQVSVLQMSPMLGWAV